jgi:hypothetical protein
MLGIALVTLVVSVDACQPFSVRFPVTFGCSSNPEQHRGKSCPISRLPPAVFAQDARQPVDGDRKFLVPVANFAALVSVFSRAFPVRDDKAMMDEATIDEAAIDEQGWTGKSQRAKVCDGRSM